MSHVLSYALKKRCAAKAFSVNKACIYSIVLLILQTSSRLWVLYTPVIVKTTFALYLDERFEVPWLQPSSFDEIFTIWSFWSKLVCISKRSFFFYFFYSCRHLVSIEEIDPVEGQTRDKNSIDSLYVANGNVCGGLCEASITIKWQKKFKRTLFIV